MASRRRNAHLTGVLAAATGAVACAIATAAWVCASTDRTPAWLFERLGVLRELRSAVTVWGVPIEFFGPTWFLGLVYLAIAQHRWPPALRIAVTFFSAVLLTGLPWRQHGASR